VRGLALLTTVVGVAALPIGAAASTGGTEYPGSAPMEGGGPAPAPSSHGSRGSSGSSGGTRAGGAAPTSSTPRNPQGEAETEPPAPASGAAMLLPNGKAKAPRGAPAAVKRALRAGNRLQGKPYRYGGGHARWEDDGYDCSGASSYALRGIDGLNSPLNSSGFITWGRPGTGRWITTYANPDHMYVIIAGLRLDTGSGGERGPRWRTTPRPPGNFTARHPAGL
jgi:cell wall-associated NlpC family hydrolase